MARSGRSVGAFEFCGMGTLRPAFIDELSNILQQGICNCSVGTTPGTAAVKCLMAKGAASLRAWHVLTSFACSCTIIAHGRQREDSAWRGSVCFRGAVDQYLMANRG
eukprot:2848625-Pleurochrysis_carterae.AAC.2